MKKNFSISLFIGITISCIALFLAFKNVPVKELIKYIKTINYIWIIPCILIGVLSFIFRAIRWQIIVSSYKKINFWQSFHPMMIGFMINCTLPGRVGELARPAILKKKENIPFTTGLATVAVERLFDMLCLILFFGIVVTIIPIDENAKLTFGQYHLNKETLNTISQGLLKISIVMITMIFLIGLDFGKKLIQKAILKIPNFFFFMPYAWQKFIETKICLPLFNITNNISLGFNLIKEFKKLLFCLSLSIIIWILQVLTYYVMAFGAPGIQLSFGQMSAVMVIICFFIALPSAPGFWGLWEAGGVFAFSLFGIESKDAAGFTLANHAVQIFPVIIIGIISAAITGINIRSLLYNNSNNN